MMTNAGGIGLAIVRRAQLFRTSCPFKIAPDKYCCVDNGISIRIEVGGIVQGGDVVEIGTKKRSSM